MGEEEGRDGKLLVLPAEPQLLAAIPSQGVDVGEESGLQGAFVVCHICEKWCVLLGLFTVALVNIHSQGYSEFKDMEDLFDLIHYSMIQMKWNKVNSYISALKPLPRLPNSSK